MKTADATPIVVFPALTTGIIGHVSGLSSRVVISLSRVIGALENQSLDCLNLSTREHRAKVEALIVRAGNLAGEPDLAGMVAALDAAACDLRGLLVTLETDSLDDVGDVLAGVARDLLARLLAVLGGRAWAW